MVCLNVLFGAYFVLIFKSRRPLFFSYMMMRKARIPKLQFCQFTTGVCQSVSKGGGGPHRPHHRGVPLRDLCKVGLHTLGLYAGTPYSPPPPAQSHYGQLQALVSVKLQGGMPLAVTQEDFLVHCATLCGGEIVRVRVREFKH